MRKLVIFLALTALATVAGEGAAPSRAVCAHCSRNDCYSSATCFSGCLCLKQGRERRGACFSVDAIPAGYSELP